ncbi:Copper-transporting P-type ATPase [Slackia heliotrinireducens]|uniref:Heavy metal translocating P-type ATPase n=1 Tax=Slackia heliotrinireducens (strain ATCC 29202 / DSM 20476 / NCTC 11029 / RHS 1) TaxID=471855 RepID=C7N8E9_SLAHD|nr:cation-translocating P-type ATPase [Slackia heliotrinireducens]ACV23184.1 heavy metal translocating P-type ATPase [Slackia heliotrinireducens DSM 20476]VEH02263.1 Copper-transporting P-type ATPase [Slackia heliotrinireducens]
MKGRIDAALHRLEDLFDIGGIKKDIVLLVISAVALVASFVAGRSLPVDPAWIAIVLCGIPILVGALVGLVTEFDIKADVLVAIALCASVAVGEYFAAGEVALIMQLGGLLEEVTAARARAGIKRLVSLTPRSAHVIGADGTVSDVPAEKVAAGATVRVLPGETVPVDGLIVTGLTSVDEAIVTGEPLPKDKGPGDEVSAGTVNCNGSVDVRATRAGDDGTIARMARLVESADAGKAKIVHLADQWATWVVVIALLAAAGTFLVTHEVLRAVTVLVVFCPCAFVLATPAAIAAGIGNATRHGFLVREGDALERLAKTNRVAFDKTGTLTEGTPELFAIEPLPESGFDERSLLGLVASAEAKSEHPLGKAVVDAARKAGIEPVASDAFEALPGLGIRARVGNSSVAVGNKTLMIKDGISLNRQDYLVDMAGQGGGSISYVAVDGALAGAVVLSDTVRTDAGEVVENLRSQGIEPVMLTGDAPEPARAVAARLGIEEIFPHYLPEDKLAAIERMESQGRKVAMIGDGVNDAPALRRAYVGLAIGGVGSDIAMEAADITVVGGIADLPHLFALSRKMMRKIKANLTFSMTLNFVAIALAIAAVLDPVTGALVHNCGSVFVVVNSALLLRWESQKG